MSCKRLGQDAKCSRAGSMNSRSKQSSQKETSLNAKFDALLNWKCIFAIPIVEMSTLIILLLNVLHVNFFTH